MTTPLPNVVELTQRLVRCDSVTSFPNENISQVTENLLRELGFEVSCVSYEDHHGTSKFRLEAVRESISRQAANPEEAGNSAGVGYFCHNDVVPVEGWNCAHSGPFEALVHAGKLWGRGACDMKGSLACALKAVEGISPSEQTGPIYFFVTGDEECGMAGASLIAKESNLYRRMVRNQHVAVIGEPTSMELVHAHKGVVHLEFSARGVAAHSSTSDGDNANWALIPFLNWLRELNDRLGRDASLRNSMFTPDTMTLNIVVENEPAACNITVGQAKVHFFLRPMQQTSWESIVQEVRAKAVEFGLEIEQIPIMHPVHTPADNPAVRRILQLLEHAKPKAVCYATDGCFFQELENLVVLGPGSIEQAHRPDEFIELEELTRGVEVFEKVFREFSC